MSKLEQAKDAILANIIRAANDDTESVESVKHLVEAYSIIVGAETQEKMTIWTTGGVLEDDDLDSFVVLLKELSKFSSDPWPWLKDIEEAMPLVHKLKKSLAGGSEADVEPLEWRRFFLLSSRGYIQFLRYNYFINNPKNAGTAQELIYVTRSVDDLFSYLGDMVDGKPEKTRTLF
jgi:hypothetical protein